MTIFSWLKVQWVPKYWSNLGQNDKK